MLQAIGNKILVLPEETKTVSSLILIENDKPKTQGIVVNVGNRVEHIKAGDRIIFNRMEAYDPGRIDVDRVPHFLMAEENVLAILEL